MKRVARLMCKVIVIIVVIYFGYNIAKAEVVANSENAFNISVEHLYNCGEVGYLHYNLSLDGEVGELRGDPDKRNIAFSLDYKKEDDSIRTIFAVVNIDSKSSEVIDEERFKTFTSPQSVGELTCMPKLEQFVEEHFSPHPGVLGGTVRYSIATWSYALNQKKVGFVVEGNDGHENFNPSLYIADKRGNNITKIDSGAMMCKDIIWLSNDELVYSKENVLWKAGYDE